MSDAAAIEWHQRTIAETDLAADVPEDVGVAFDRLRETHTYGCFSYGLFTVADTYSHTVVELALRRRFHMFYDGRLMLRRTDTDDVLVLEEETPDALLRKLRNKSRKNWLLDTGNGDLMCCNGGLGQLIAWAFRTGLFEGQRNRVILGAMKNLRNLTAHPSSANIVDPTHSAQSIRDTAEIINQLWGHTTPNGRIFPGPINREAVVVGWNNEFATTTQLASHALRADKRSSDSWRYVVLNAVAHDPLLNRFHTDFERTTYPADLLWGPGEWNACTAWLASAMPIQNDAVPFLDRRFLVQVIDGAARRSRRPEVALALSADEVEGCWWLVKADHPNAAYAHVRGPGGNPHWKSTVPGFCSECHVDVLAVGDWDQISGAISDAEPADRRLPPVAVPHLLDHA